MLIIHRLSLDARRMDQEVKLERVAKRTGRNIFKLVLALAGYVITSLILNLYLPGILKGASPSLAETYLQYLPYVNLVVMLGFGYLIVILLANLIYWNLRLKHPHSTAQVIRNAVKIIGIGALIASALGGSGNAATGLAIGGFMGIVAGFATRKVLGQAVAGLFLLLMRPFKIGDRVIVSGEEGIIKDITTFYTKIEKADGDIALIPNDGVIGGKIVLKKSKPTQQ